MKKKLIPIILIVSFLLTGGVIALFVLGSSPSETQPTTELTDEELEALAENMPEIVFVFCSVSNETKGHFIDKNGNLNHFKFENTFKYEDFVVGYSGEHEMNWKQYAEKSILNDLQQMINKNADEAKTESNFISQRDLGKYYELLLRVDSHAKVEPYSIMGSMDVKPFFYMYAIRINDNGEEEIILLKDGGEGSLATKDRNAEELFEQLRDIFPDANHPKTYW